MLQSKALSNDEPALAAAPTICAAQKLLAFLLEYETIGLTQGKAFQRRFVHWAAAEFSWPGWEEDKLFRFNKVLNEFDFSRPGKPTDNAFIEAFNGRFRPECLNQHWFMSLADAREKLEAWRGDYNTVRSHSAIGNKPPITLMNHIGETSPPM